MDHFVVLKKVTRSHLVLHDPAYGVKAAQYLRGGKAFDRDRSNFSRSKAFQRKDRHGKAEIFSLWPHIRGSSAAFLQVFVLSLILNAVRPRQSILSVVCDRRGRGAR